MTILGGIALLALTLAGYGGAAVMTQRVRKQPPAPDLGDTINLLLLWAGGIGLPLAGLAIGRAIALAVGAALLLAVLRHGLRPAAQRTPPGWAEFRPLVSPAPSAGAWNAWKSFARASGDFQARLLLHLFYFLVIGPFSLLVLRSDPLWRRRAPGPSYWLARSEDPATLEEARKQG